MLIFNKFNEIFQLIFISFTEGLDGLDAVLFHAPYCKLVQKALARLALNDFLREEGTANHTSLTTCSQPSEVVVNGNGIDNDSHKLKLVIKLRFNKNFKSIHNLLMKKYF